MEQETMNMKRKEGSPVERFGRSCRGENIEALVNKGASFYEACRRSLLGDSFRSVQHASTELADLGTFFRLLGESRLEEPVGTEVQIAPALARLGGLYVNFGRSGLRALPFSEAGRCRKFGARPVRRDWRCLVFNFLVSRGIPELEARDLVEEIDGYKNRE